MKKLLTTLLITTLYLSFTISCFAASKLTIKQKETMTKAHAEKVIDICIAPKVDKLVNLFPCIKRPDWATNPDTFAVCAIKKCKDYVPKPYENKEEIFKSCMDEANNEAIKRMGWWMSDALGGQSTGNMTERCRLIKDYKYISYDKDEGAYFQFNYRQPVTGLSGNKVTSEIISYNCEWDGYCGSLGKLILRK